MKRLIISVLAFLPVMAFPQAVNDSELRIDSIVLPADSVQNVSDTVTAGNLLPGMVVVPKDSIDNMRRELQRNAMLLDSLQALNSRMTKYEQHLEKHHRLWLSLMPSTVRIQYAGSIGLINLGMGWEYGKRHQWETDFMFGLVPKYDKDEAFATFTLRQTYVPWTKKLFHNYEWGKGPYRYTWQPLSCGLFLNSVLHGNYWTKEPERYPDQDYYRFSSKIRFHLFVGQRYTIHVPREKRWLPKEASFVWELSTCDLYVVSKFVNASLPLKDILSLSLGLKLKMW